MGEQPEDLIRELKESLAEEEASRQSEVGQESEQELDGLEAPEGRGGVETPVEPEPQVDEDLGRTDVPEVGTPGGGEPQPVPEVRVQVPVVSPPQVQDLPPMPQRV